MVLLALTLTGVRPKELRTVTVDEFDRVNRQWVLWRHKVVEKTGQPKVVALGSDELFDRCVASVGDRPRDEPLFLTERGKPWTYQAMRLRWRRLRGALGLDSRFTLYTFRHWYLTVAVESGEDGEIVAIYFDVAFERAAVGVPGELVGAISLDRQSGNDAGCEAPAAAVDLEENVLVLLIPLAGLV